jgi:hypothetical protein
MNNNGDVGRTFYERAADVLGERRVVERIERVWKCSVEKLPIKNRLDGLLRRRNALVGYIEVKVRKCAREAYPTFMVSLDKWMYARQLAENSGGVPVFFVVEWTDGVYWIRQDEATYTVGIGGRSDRNDPLDTELCIHVPVHLFKPLPTSPGGSS